MELKPIRNLKYSRQKLQDCNSCHYHDHVINFNNAAIIDNCKQLSIRKLSDSWHTMTTTRVDNNSCSLSVLLCLFYLLKNCSLGSRKLAFLKHLKPEKKIHFFVCRRRQPEHTQTPFEGQSAYHRDSDLQLRESHYTFSTVKRTVERNCSP